MSRGRGLLGLTPGRLAALKAKLAEEGLADGGGMDTAAISPIPPIPPGAPAPLSFAQESFWFIEQLQPGSGLYNVAFAWHLEGPLDVAALRTALAELVRRHEVLRMRVEVQGGQPVQGVRPDRPATLPVVDLSRLERRQDLLLHLAGVEARRPFDLHRGPLHRAALVELGGERAAFLLFFHHMVVDRGSMEVFCRELGEVYAAVRQGRAVPLAPPRRQYSDFAAWQRRELAEGSPERERHLSFWRAALAGRPEELALPTDHPRPARPAFHLGSLPIALPEAETERLRALARRRGATLFMTGLAVFGAWLSRLAAVDDLLVGVPSSHRQRQELQGVLGPFVDLLVLRVTAGGDASDLSDLSGWVDQVRDRALAAYAHQELPFEALVRELAPHRRADRNPLCQVSFSLDPDELGSGIRFPGLRSRLETLQLSPFQFDLVLRLYDGASGLSGFLNFQRELFDATTARRWRRQLGAFFAAVAADPGAPLAALPLLDPAERHQLAVEWNDTAVDLPAEPLVHRRVAAQAAATPDAVAVVADAAEDAAALSYGELARRAGRLRLRLARALAGTAEPRVGLVLDRSPEMVVAMLAVLAAGGAYVPVDPHAPPERIDLLLRQSGAAAVLTGDDLREIRENGDPPPEAIVLPGQLAYVIHTSGSTGTPKGVGARHDALGNVALWHVRRYDIGPDDRVTHLASPTFDAAAAEIWPTLLAGACLVLPPSEVVASPPALASYLASRQVTLSCLPTPLAEAVLAEPVPPGTVLRALLTGGEALRGRPPAAVPYPVVNHYGPTEGTVDATTGTVAPQEENPRLPALGRPIGNVRVYVLDRRLEPVPIGVPGELWIGGAGLARGYLDRPEATAASFRPDPWGRSGQGERLYRTGDRALLRADGEVEFLGRLDRQVKIRGFRIEPGEVQAILGRHPEVGESFVTTRPDAQGELQLAAFVVPRPGRSPSPGSLRDFVAARLPRHLVPAAFTVLAALPLTPQGKVGLAALPAPQLATAGAVPPQSPVEQVVAEIWEELLGRTAVGRDDDFFALGGHSLLATRVLARLRQLFGVEVGLRALFESPTVAELARAVERARETAAGPPPPLVPVPRGPRLPEMELPLSHAQQRLWFLDRLEPGSTVYNLPVAYRLLGRWEPRFLAAALAAVVERQESLRTTFPAGSSGPVQAIAPAGRGSVRSCGPAPSGASRSQSQVLGTERSPGRPPTLPVVDLAALSAGRRRAAALALTNAEARRPFDLAAGPLFRPLLLRLSAEEQVLLLALHHAVADGWSIGILLHELAVLYGVAAGGRPAPLPALPVQYVDFAVWQNAWLAGPGLDRSLDAWRERLAGAPAVLDLPTDRPRPVVRGNRGGLVPVTLDAGLTQDLRALGRRAGTPLFLTVLAGFQALLQRLSGQSDLVVGIPEAGRGRVEIENLIGFFVNALALRTDLAGDPVVDALLRRVRESALHAYAHAEVPFDRVVEALAPERRLDRSPLFQVSFTLDAATALPRLPDPAAPAAPADPTKALSMEALPLAIGSAKFDLTLALVEPAAEIAGMGGRLEYDRDLFDAATAERLVRHLAILLRGAVAEPGARLSALPLLSAAEQHQLLVTWNLPATGSTAFPRETPLHQLFAGQARQRPEATAVVDAGRHLSYGALAARSSALARRLRAAGVGLDVPVALCLERSPELILAILAVLQAGGAYLPLDPAYPRERLAFLLADSGAPVAVTTASLAAVLPAAGLLRRLLLEEDESTPEAPGAPDLPEVVATGDALAYILYTSGSTGQPKGVAVPHRGVVGRVIGTDYLRFAPGDRMAQAANPVFDIATLEIWGPLATGGTLVLLGPEIVARPAALAAALRAEAIDTLILATALVHQTARELPDAFAPLDTLIVGGEALDPGTVRRLLAAGPPRRLVNGYGPTESTAISTWFEIAGVPVGASTLPIGRPVAQTRVFVCDAALCPVPVGVAGQLYLGGDGLARGYWRQPERTAERFVPDPFAALQGGRPGGRLYATGDRVRWCADGVLEFLGRLDGQVKIRGFRIEPGEIEAVLAAHPAVEQAVVVARETPEILGGERRLVAYLVPAPGVAPGVSGVVAVADVAELRRFLAERLPAHLVPAHFVPLEAFPLTATGKVDRRALPDPDPHAAPADPAAGHVAPRTPLEEEVAAIWREVLGVSRVGIHDSFWELGGHSLLATRILARLEAALGVALPLQTLFLDPTLVGLTNALGERLLALAGEENGEENGQETGETPPAEPLPRLPQIPRAPRGEGVELPASFGQQRLWFLDRLQPGSAVYNLPVAWQLLGPWEPGLLAASLGEIVRRHEALRTTFVESPRGPLQRIAPAGPALGQVDLSGLPVSARRAAALRWVESEAQRPFDLARGPLLRLLLLRLSGEEQILFLALHHIVADGWSLDVLRRELRALYRASPLPELPVQYADFAIWQQGWLAGPLLAGQLAYWRDRLAGAPLALDLPTDRPHPPVEGFRGGAERVRLEAEVSRDLAALGRRRQAPLFMVLLAGWQALLGRYTGQEDLLVGVPTAGRSWVELEDLVGFFVNLLVLRTDLAGDPPFAALLGRVRDSALGAYEHADLPLERLVEELQPERSLRRSPLFQVVFTLQTAPVTLPPPLPGDLRLADLPLASGTAKFDLTLTLAESAAGLSGEIYYRRDLFDATTVQRMAGHLERLLSGIAQDPERRLSELPLLSAGEEAQALWEGSDAERWEPSGPALLVHERVAEQARRQPDAVAVAAGPARLTYGELAARAARLARHLRRRGVGPESRVAICAEGIERVIAMLGVLQAGGAFVPLDPAHPAERRAALVAAAGATVVLRDRDVADLAALPGDPPPAGRLVPESLAYVVFTSGSTGEPKGVAVPHAGLRNLVRWYEEDLALTPADHGTAVASPAFDAAVWEVWPLLAAGGCLHFADAEARLSPHRLARWWVEEGITVSFLPTPLAEPLLAAGFPPGTRHALRRLSVGGDRLRRRPHPDLGFPLVNAYGPSEYSVVATAGPVPLISPADSGLPAIGRAIDNTSLYIVDSHLNLLPPGMPGELCIAGAGLARGYLDRPDRTAERFLPDPWGALRGAPGARMYRSGDRVRRRTDGALDFLGRLDHQVKLRGMRVEPGEIEATLARHPAVREAVVLVREDRPGDRRLVAYVVPAPDTAPAIADLSADLSADLTRLLPALMVPQDWVFLPALPLTGNGKVDRKALPAPERVIAGTAESVAPRTPLEELLAGIFGAVLGQERVGIEDDFFALGGHSLLATQVVSRVRQALAVELPVRALFEAPTVGGLARRIAAERSAADTPDPSSRPPLVRIARRDGMPLPLSFAQQRLWFIDRLEPGSALYNIPLAYRVEGALAVAALGQALAEIVRRHEALRTTFVPGDATGGEPIQQIAPAAPAAPADASILSDPGRLCQVDLEALPEWLRSVELRRLAAAEAARPFDLARGPLLRATLIRLTAEEHALFLSLHHIVADGWSMGVLLQELAALYAAALADPGPRRAPLPELALQYADFALWQRGWLRGPVLEREVEHWRGRLAGVPAALDLPADRPRPAVQSYRGGALYRRLPSSLGKAVEATGRELGATPFMVLLAAFATLLSRASRQDDLAIGTPIAGRTHRELEDLIGFFVNTLVLRCDLSGAPSFARLVGRVREVALDGHAHQDLPFEKLVEALEPERTLSHSPLFQVMFVLQNAPHAAAFPDLRLIPEESVGSTAKFDLLLALRLGDEGLEAALEYGADRFDRATAARLFDHFERLLAAAVADPGRRVIALPLLSAAERAQLLVEWNDTAAPAVSAPGDRELLHDPFTAQALETPDRTALVFGAGHLSYAALDRRSNRLAHLLRRRGVGPEVVVGISVQRSFALIEGLLAILKAGGVLLPLDPSYPAERLGYMVADTRPALLVADTVSLSQLPELGEEVVVVDDLPLALGSSPAGGDPGAAPTPPPVGADLAYLIYTSGSTGQPKGIAMPHRAIASLVDWQRRRSPWEGARTLQFSPLSFDVCFQEMFSTWAVGGIVVLLSDPDRRDAAALLRTLERHEVERLDLPFVGLHNLVEMAAAWGAAPAALREVVTAGEALRVSELLAGWFARLPGCRLENHFGPSEAHVVTAHRLSGPPAGWPALPPVGRPVPRTRVHLLDAELEPVPIGVAGEVYVGGAQLARGYLNRPGTTAERFLPDPFAGRGEPGGRLYKTGDLARLQPAGEIEFLGRVDFQVKVRGFRVELGEIEAALALHEAVRAVAVEAPEIAGLRRLVAYVVAAPGADAAPAELRRFLAERLPVYMIPAHFVPLAALPVAATGKVDRRALPLPDPRSGEDAAYVAPRTPLEEEVAGIWAQVLGANRVGINDSFWDLGGHSLLATKVLSRLHSTLGVELSLQTLFKDPTILGLTAAIGESLLAMEGAESEELLAEPA